MENMFNKDNVTIVRKKGDDYEIANVPVRISREATIARLKNDPDVVFVMEAIGRTCTAATVLAEGSEMKVTLIDGDRPEGRVDISTIQHEDRSAGVYMAFHGDSGEDYDDVFKRTMDYAMHMYLNGDDFDPACFYSNDGEKPVILTPQAREAIEEDGTPVDGFIAADVDFEPFTFEHNGEVVLLGSEHFNGYDLFVEVKRLFIGANDIQKEEAVRKVNVEGRIMAICCADGSVSFRKSFEISDPARVAEEIYEAVDALVEGIEPVGSEPAEEYREEVLRHLFTWEVLDAVVRYKQLPI